MARMHARRKGKSCSKRPLITENPAWVTLSATEIEDIIVKMAKDGNNSVLIPEDESDLSGVVTVLCHLHNDVLYLGG